MAVHPFAKKCEAVIASLREILANLKRKKKTAKKMGGGSGESDDRRVGRWNDIPARRIFGSPEAQHQAYALGSERGINANYDKAQPVAPKQVKLADKRMEALVNAYAYQSWLCKRKTIAANEAYWRCLYKKGGTRENCGHLIRQVTCPGVERARRALSEYAGEMENRKRAASGGGGGGGF